MKRSIFILVFTVIFVSSLFFSVSILAEDPLKININTAPVEELVKLDKIGPQYAQRIVEYREKEGAFTKPEEIMKVKGIGPQTYEANKERITCE